MASIQDVLRDLREIDFGELSLDNIGSWPLAVKVIVWALAFVACLALGYVYNIADLRQELYDCGPTHRSVGPRTRRKLKICQARDNADKYKCAIDEPLERRQCIAADSVHRGRRLREECSLDCPADRHRCSNANEQSHSWRTQAGERGPGLHEQHATQ